MDRRAGGVLMMRGGLEQSCLHVGMAGSCVQDLTPLSLQIIAPYAHFDIPRIGQAYVLFRSPPPLLHPMNVAVEEGHE